MKKILAGIGIGVGLFVVLVGIIFGVLSYLEPMDESLPQLMGAGSGKPVSSQLLDQKQLAIDSLAGEVSKIKSELFFANLAMDSLREQLLFKDALMEGYKKTIEKLNDDLLALNQREVNIKELAQTYETMKADEIRPILEKVDNETVIAIYKNMSSRTRKIIMKALSEERAAAITQQLAGA